jgi:serine/threonine-protein kinase HipA
VDQFGTYIIKPQNDLFPQLPENEDVTMRMAKVFGLEVPFHGCYGKDGSLSYFIKRFDR